MKVLTQEERQKFSLWDSLAGADWMSYPSKTEGFGNQFLEGVFFRKPIFLNRYEVYKRDLEPLGFEVAESLEQVKNWMNNKESAQKAAEEV